MSLSWLASTWTKNQAGGVTYTPNECMAFWVCFTLFYLIFFRYMGGSKIPSIAFNVLSSRLVSCDEYSGAAVINGPIQVGDRICPGTEDEEWAAISSIPLCGVCIVRSNL